MIRLRIAGDVIASYHPRIMELIKQGSQRVAKLVTPSGVTAWIDTSIPANAIKAFKQQLQAKRDARKAKPHKAPPTT